MPRYEVYIPPTGDESFRRTVARIGGEVVKRDLSDVRDYEGQFETLHDPFVQRLNLLLEPSNDPYLEDRRLTGFATVIPELSDRMAFREADVDELPVELLEEFRTVLVGRMLSGLTPEPAKVPNGDVKAALGIAPVEMIILQFGLEDGMQRTLADVGRILRLEPQKVKREMEVYFNAIKNELRLPRRKATPMRETMHKIQRMLELRQRSR